MRTAAPARARTHCRLGSSPLQLAARRLSGLGVWPQGCVAASFVLEAQGVPRKPPQKKDVQKEAARRLEALAPRARQLAAPRSAA